MAHAAVLRCNRVAGVRASLHRTVQRRVGCSLWHWVVPVTTQALCVSSRRIKGVHLGWYGTDVDGRILPHAADLPLLRDESESESDEQ